MISGIEYFLAGSERAEVLEALADARELLWENPKKLPWEEAKRGLRFGQDDIDGAEERLRRFAPLIERLFPETSESGGIIESSIREIPGMAEALGLSYGAGSSASGPRSGGRLLLKMDSHLPIAGSVKARGGIYEVLKHTEDLAIEAGLLKGDGSDSPEDYSALADRRDFFSAYSVQVGSTGNLGLSIGIMSAAIGYRAVVHMSSDAKEWKKRLLRSRGAEVVEYDGDYAAAVAEGRRLSDADPMSYFVDDESSESLYLGYATAGRRLKSQLDGLGVAVDEAHPLRVFIPCGVGGAPGGICFGIKEQFGDLAQVWFAEPVQAPCMTLGLASGRLNGICVQDIGLSGATEADGLAVSRCSGLVSREMRRVLDGCCTVDDSRLRPFMRELYEAEGIVIEPSSCAAFRPLEALGAAEKADAAGRAPAGAEDIAGSSAPEYTDIVWATGGSFMPEETVRDLLGMPE